ncbi:4'-phosphopantetheinyl transferase family protein [Nocardioides rubriscoriae]|uniref:4'-phosphopantetheinyl transferase family protein n=1 Tax=Nocardioides rubriscoriae TaxID=642762 RepID=UPI001478BBA3|nr:4'-phosphopantetheinyl transferase superfamily protein [Nocardioides rubriscoriae]
MPGVPGLTRTAVAETGGEDGRRAARTLARRLVTEATGHADVRFTQVCAQCGGPHGRPTVVGGDAHVGWSHTAGLVAAVVADAPCAIDVESLPRVRERDLPLDLLATDERAWVAAQPDAARAFAELWVRKEVLVKLGEVTLDEALGLDVLAALSGEPVLGHTLVPLDVTPYDAVGAWAVAATAPAASTPTTTRSRSRG